MSLRVEGLEGVRALLLGGQAEAASGVLAQRLAPRVKPILLAGLGRAFRQQGPGWRTLKPSTQGAKRRRGQPSRVGEASGRLKASFSQDGSPDQQWSVTPDALTLSSAVPYAPYFDRDRPIRLPQESEAEIDRIVQNTILDALGQRR